MNKFWNVIGVFRWKINFLNVVNAEIFHSEFYINSRKNVVNIIISFVCVCFQQLVMLNGLNIIMLA